MENVLENALTEAEQYVRECEQLVRKQAALVDELEKHDCPAAAEDARATLAMLEKDLAEARAYLRMERAAGLSRRLGWGGIRRAARKTRSVSSQGLLGPAPPRSPNAHCPPGTVLSSITKPARGTREGDRAGQGSRDKRAASVGLGRRGQQQLGCRGREALAACG
jgi:hypothetical protein